jgi:hypothetical protein
MRGRPLTLRVAAVTAAVGLGLALGPAGAEAASTPHWQVSYRTHSATPAPLDSVTAPGKYDAWAAGVAGSGSGARPDVLHWNGRSWTRRAMPADFRPALVEASSTSNVWVIGATSTFTQEAMVWNGSKWSTVSTPFDFGDGPVAVLSRSDVWGAVGSDCAGNTDPTCTTTFWHWNGSTWTSVTLDMYLEGIAGAGGHAWLFGLTALRNYNGGSGDPTGAPVIYRTTGASVAKVTAPGRRLYDFAQITAAPSGQLWVLGSPGSNKNATLLFHWTGRAWTSARVPAKVGSAEPFIIQDPLVYDGHSGVWAGSYAHWTGTKWINAFQVASLPGTDGFGIGSLAPIPGTSSVWGAGLVGRSPTNNTHDSLIAIYGAVP